MAILLLGLALPMLLALVVMDVVVLRHADRFDGAEPEPEERIWPEEPPPVVTWAAYVSLGVGALSFPATLAPVVMTVLALQGQQLLSESWISLVAIVVAALSMSAAIKGLRISHLLRNLTLEMLPLLKTTSFYLVLWESFVLFLAVLMRRPTGNLAVLIWGYVAVIVLGTSTIVAAVRTALAASESTSSPTSF